MIGCCQSEHLPWYGREQARAIAGEAVSIDAPAMRKPLQRDQRTLHYLMCRATPELYNEARTASVMIRVIP
jgi:hypothetical protein